MKKVLFLLKVYYRRSTCGSVDYKCYDEFVFDNIEAMEEFSTTVDTDEFYIGDFEEIELNTKIFHN